MAGEDTSPRRGNAITRSGETVLRVLGKPFTANIKVFLRLLRLFRATLKTTLRGRWSWAHTVEQMYLVGNRSILFITVTLGVLGVITIYQTATQVQRILPDFTMMGPTFIKVMIKQMGATITALMIATRVGTGIAAEIGSMVVTEQVDALKMSNTDPVEYLIVPRFIACTLMVLVLTVFGILVATITGMFTAQVGFGVNPLTFWSLSLTEGEDVFMLVWRCLTYGAVIPVISAQAGLEAKGGSEGVGWATTRAVVNSSFAVIFLDFLLSTAGYLIFEQ